MEVLLEKGTGAIILLWSTNDHILKIFSFLFNISRTDENSLMKIPWRSVFSLPQSLIPAHFPGLCCQTILLFNICQMAAAPDTWRTHTTLSFPWALARPHQSPANDDFVVLGTWWEGTEEWGKLSLQGWSTGNPGR